MLSDSMRVRAAGSAEIDMGFLISAMNEVTANYSAAQASGLAALPFNPSVRKSPSAHAKIIGFYACLDADAARYGLHASLSRRRGR
jgi:hypothetical protein